MNVYAIVTDKIIKLLEQDVIQWRRPWTAAGLPRNLVSRKSYRGINLFLLPAAKYASPLLANLQAGLISSAGPYARARTAK